MKNLESAPSLLISGIPIAGPDSPNQVLTHAARAAAKQLNKAPLVAARGAHEGLWLEQGPEIIEIWMRSQGMRLRVSCYLGRF